VKRLLAALVCIIVWGAIGCVIGLMIAGGMALVVWVSEGWGMLAGIVASTGIIMAIVGGIIGLAGN